MVYERSERDPQDFVENLGERGHKMREQAAERLRGARQYVREKTSDVSSQVQEKASQAKDWFSDTMDEYPMAVGAGCVLLGIAVGMAIPTSKPERRLMGQTGQRVMNKARSAGSQIIDRGEEAAERAVEAARSAVKRRRTSSSPAGDSPI